MPRVTFCGQCSISFQLRVFSLTHEKICIKNTRFNASSHERLKAFERRGEAPKALDFRRFQPANPGFHGD